MTGTTLQIDSSLRMSASSKHFFIANIKQVSHGSMSSEQFVSGPQTQS